MQIKNIQDRVSVVRREFSHFQAKLPMFGNERRKWLNSRLNPSGHGELKARLNLTYNTNLNASFRSSVPS